MSASTIAPTSPVHTQDEPLTFGDHGGYPIYAMPVFASLVATDLVATVRFFTDALDFGVMFAGPQVAGVPMLVRSDLDMPHARADVHRRRHPR
jgi:hypothetical protein